MLVYITALGGVLLSIAGIALTPAVARLLGAEGDLLRNCTIYGRLGFITLAPFMLQNAFQSFFVAAEKPKLGLAVIVIAGVTNIVLDYLFVNEDRHLNNFGVVRKAESLKYMCAAPIFDSGTSMWFDKPTAMIGDTPKLVCKPFKNTHEEQIKLVSSFDWLAMEKWRQTDIFA